MYLNTFLKIILKSGKEAIMEITDLSRRERKKLESRARILKAARRLFQEKDYDSTSIEEIAEMADVSKSTFFNYFPTKESLLDGIAADEIAEIQFLIEADLFGVTSPVEKIRIVMKHFATDSSTYLKVTRKVIWATVFRSDGFPMPVMEMEKILVELINEAQEKGEIRKDLKSLEIASAIMGMYFAAFFHWIREEQDSLETPEFVLDYILDMLFTGIAGANFENNICKNSGAQS